MSIRTIPPRPRLALGPALVIVDQTCMIAFAGVTYLSVVVAELMPKALRLDRAETMAVLVAGPIELAVTRAVLA